MDGLLTVVGIAFCIVLAIAWVMVPFAILGLKDLTKETLKELKTLREIFERIEAAK